MLTVEAHNSALTKHFPGLKMKIPVERSPGNSDLVVFDAAILGLISHGPTFVHQLTDAFELNKRVQDVWRYAVKVQGGKVAFPLSNAPGRHLKNSKFADVYARYAVGKNVILLLLESPHVDEYSYEGGLLFPIAPAQRDASGGAGHGIREYLHRVLDKLVPSLPDGEYALVIANPVPYHCSLSWLGSASTNAGRIKPKALNSKDGRRVRNHVWEQLWGLDFIREYFLERCNLYQPSVILNCCTDELKDDISRFLCVNGYGHSLFTTKHPSVNWNIGYGKGGAGHPVSSVNSDDFTLARHTS